MTHDGRFERQYPVEQHVDQSRRHLHFPSRVFVLLPGKADHTPQQASVGAISLLYLFIYIYLNKIG